MPGRIYPPPYDLCLARRERRSYRSPSDGKKNLGKESACHYHFKKSFVVKADPPIEEREYAYHQKSVCDWPKYIGTFCKKHLGSNFF